MLAVVFVPRRSRVVWTPGMPPERKDSRRNRDAPALRIRLSLSVKGCQIARRALWRRGGFRRTGESAGDKAVASLTGVVP